MTGARAQVSGTGCICAAGVNTAAVMDSLYRGERNPQAPRLFTTGFDQPYPVFEVETELESCVISDGIEAIRSNQLLLKAVNEALEQAGLDENDLKNKKVGVCLGTTVACTLNNETFYRAFKNNEKPDNISIRKFLANNPAQFLARKLKLNGPVTVINNACSSATDAIGLAKWWLQDNQCDIVIAGGCDELGRITCLGFASLMVTSLEPCRPFDKKRNGLNLGEGAGIVILEREDDLAKRGGKAMAQVAGYGCFADAFHPTAPHPDGEGLCRAIDFAVKDADVEISQINFVNAHGTSTPANDKAEGSVLSKMLVHKPPVLSTKCYTGHTLGAAGGIEAVFCVRGLLDQKLPATLGFENFDEECGISPIVEITELKAEVCLSNSLAFGGTNSALIFKRVGS